jgi:tetratricopeptide (TPR) repeat protein
LRLDPGLTGAALEYGKLLPARNARQLWQAALRRDPLNVQLQQAYFSAIEDPEENQRARQRYAVLNRGEFREALANLDRGDFPAAARALKKILEMHPELSEVRRRLAFVSFANRQYQEATAEYDILARAQPGEADLRLSLGVALRESSALDRATQELEEAVRLNPDSAQAHYQLGLTLLAQKENRRAMEQFHKARRIDPLMKPPGS